MEINNNSNSKVIKLHSEMESKNYILIYCEVVGISKGKGCQGLLSS